MLKVFLYSTLLVIGLLFSFLLDLSIIRPYLTLATLICLAYIMIEVGYEFTLDKKNLRSYGKDYLIAMTTAGLPWLFVTLYLVFVLKVEWKGALLLGRFAAPTSAGILFTLLAAAGLGTTWVFKKARILAIFDDLDTILLMIPLQILLIGWKPSLLAIIPVVLLLLLITYHYLHRVKLPTGCAWNMGYAVVIVLFCDLVHSWTLVEIEVLLPSFVFGAILFNPHDPLKPKKHAHEHAFIEPEKRWAFSVDRIIKGIFMFLVGASLPRIDVNGYGWWTLLHVIVITLLMNKGKLFPVFCYRKEAKLRTRFALAISLFPRGEVGAGILLVSVQYGISQQAVGIAELALALNILLTGFFIWGVIKVSGRRHLA